MPKCILCERPLTLFKCIKILFSRPGAPQSQQASLPGRFLRPEITARTSSCRPLSWNWSWSPPRAVFKASSLLFCSTDTHLREDKWRDYKKKTSIHINRWPFRYIRCIFNISMSFFILLSFLFFLLLRSRFWTCSLLHVCTCCSSEYDKIFICIRVCVSVQISALTSCFLARLQPGNGMCDCLQGQRERKWEINSVCAFGEPLCKGNIQEIN